MTDIPMANQGVIPMAGGDIHKKSALLDDGYKQNVRIRRKAGNQFTPYFTQELDRNREDREGLEHSKLLTSKLWYCRMVLRRFHLHLALVLFVVRSFARRNQMTSPGTFTIPSLARENNDQLPRCIRQYILIQITKSLICVTVKYSLMLSTPLRNVLLKRNQRCSSGPQVPHSRRRTRRYQNFRNPKLIPRILKTA